MKSHIALLVVAAMVIAILPFAISCDSSSPERSIDLECGQINEEVVYNEYDYIVKIREVEKQNPTWIGLSDEGRAYVTSNAIETELLERAALSQEELQNHYCYSEEAISILKAYDGTALENAPEMRAVMACISTTLKQTVLSETQIGVVYTWEWNTKPVCTYTDGVTIAWDGTYECGLDNNLRFDIHSSSVSIHYYLASNEKEIVQLDKRDFSSDAYTNGVTVQFSYMESLHESDYWAKSGEAVIYTTLVNQENGPALYGLDVYGKYIHAMSDAPWRVSFPLGISIDISGDVYSLGGKQLLLYP